jgi:hypothetical protein
MARQNNTPVQFQRTTRKDTAQGLTSGRAGKVHCIDYIPVLRGDSLSGKFGVDIDLAEMPKPLQNGVQAQVQAWFVPKAAHPQFSGYDEFMHSYQGDNISQLGAASRTPPAFFNVLTNSTNINTYRNSAFAKILGLHFTPDHHINTDLLDAFNLTYNFRLAAHSSRLSRVQYAQENLANALAQKRAFWPSYRYSRVVPDYERALIVGSLDLDVTAGQIPIKGLWAGGDSSGDASPVRIHSNPPNATDGMYANPAQEESDNYHNLYAREGVSNGDNIRTIYADMVNQTVGTTLADIDKARTTQAFAKLRTAYAGNDATGFDNDDTIVAELMQGFNVPQDMFKRPWLLDSKRAMFGMVERHATDGASLDDSVTKGRATAQLSLNLPKQDTGGVIIITVEVVPEKLIERQACNWCDITTPSQFPDALRDVQRVEPVDIVVNKRLDAAHATPYGAYGYEPMNDQWNRDMTRLGGDFYQGDPDAIQNESRLGIWVTNEKDVEYNDTHYLVPETFPHYIFSDTLGDAFECTFRHDTTIVGLTQFGDVLAENNDDYDAITSS